MNMVCSGRERLARVLVVLTLDHVVPPVVPALAPVDVAAGASHHEHGLHVRTGLQRFVDRGLERARCATAKGAVGRDDVLTVRVQDPTRERLGGEPREDDGVNGTESHDGEHGDNRFGNHRHVDRDAVTFFYSEFGERVRRLGYELLEFGVGNGTPLAFGVGHPVKGDLVTFAGLDVAVDARVGSVDRAVAEPFRERQVPLEVLRRWRRPGQTVGLRAPPRDRVLSRVGVHGRLRVGLFGEHRRRGETASLFEPCFEVLLQSCSSLALEVDRATSNE